MNFINNWRQQLALAVSAESVSLDLPDGEYVLTLSDALGQSATRWEYIRAVVAGGVATLQRGQEGSTAQDWPAGSWIYCSVTTGTLVQLFAAVSGLQARVEVLENALRPSETVAVTAGVLGDPSAMATGWVVLPEGAGEVGSAMPQQLTVPGHGSLELVGLYYASGEGQPDLFTVQLAGNASLEGVDSLVVDGIGTLSLADSDPPFYQPDPDRTWIVWHIGSADWVDGAQRNVKFNYLIN